VELRAKHAEGQKWFGVDVREGKVADIYSKEIFDPLVVKEQIIKSATDAASMILRVDDVIAAGKMKETKPPKPGGEEGGGEE
ncbi:MAG: TCP-1/cpn60 chaperonin family protein, partial [Nitrososphaerales archaeon]